MKNIKNIIYLCNSEKGASGGAKIIYHHSEIINNFNKDISLVSYALKNNLGTSGIDVAVNITNGKSRKIILEDIPHQSPIDVRINVNCDNTDWNQRHKTITVNVNDGQTTLITVKTQSNLPADDCCSCFDLVN